MGKITTKKRILFSFRGQVTINGQIMSEKPGIFCAQNGQKLWVFDSLRGGWSNEDHCHFWTNHRCSDHGSLCTCFADLRLCKGITFFVPRVTGESYLPDGTAQGGVIVNTKSAFRIAYKESNRGYSDTLELQGCVSDAAATRERCCCRSRRRLTSRIQMICWIWQIFSQEGSHSRWWMKMAGMLILNWNGERQPDLPARRQRSEKRSIIKWKNIF